MASDYTFYKRTTKNNKKTYYVRFRDPETGERLSGISTGCPTKGDADRWARDYIAQGNLNKKSTQLFANYAKDWFAWGRCSYIKIVRQKGQRFSKGYADACRRHLDNHILPFFKNKKLKDIKVTDLESFLSYLSTPKTEGGKEFSTSSVNSIYQVLKIMLEEAYRKELINTTPTERVNKIVRTHKETGLIPLEKIKELFREDTIQKVWNNNVIHFTLNLVSASTGMRQGEILALRIRDIHERYIDVTHTWDRKYGLKEPKYNSKRKIPIPELTSKYLSQLIFSHPYSDELDALIFFGKKKETAIDHKAVNKHFHRSMENVGIENDTRKELNITFHSWRHTFNTMMRNKISDYKLRQLTGHKSEAMTDHYTHFSIDDYQDVAKIQNQLFNSQFKEAV